MKQIFKIVILLISCNLFVSLEGVRLLNSDDDDNECKAWLVQSIPTDMPQLPLVPGVLATADVLRWLAGNASHNLDIMAQYWQLVAHPDDPNSGDYGYSKEEMQSFGSNDGASVYKSIEEAADRNVNVRLLQHSGVYPDYTREPSDLASGRPNVKNVTLLISDWFESGVLHAKVWISDSRHVYIGSANNDWKSLTQVKEVGIYLADCPKIAKKVEVFYNNLWKLGFMNHSDFTRKIWDEQWQISRTVPCWSHFIPHKKRCKSPLPRYVDVHHTAGYPMITDPSHFHKPIQTPGCNYSANSKAPLSYLSFAPPELSFKKYQADEQAWVETIKSVTDGETVRISTMDWLGQSEYASQTVYWSSLSTAISEVIFSKHAKVKILVAYWAHFIDNTDVYLKSLLYSNILCSSSPYNRCSGKIEIKYYMVPDFNSTGPAIINGTSTGNKYPGFTRVNHGKYAVSDKRAHIGTSNLMWDYFYATVGVSFGTYNPGIVAQLQQIFDADWNSPYAVPVEPLQDGHAYSS
ncbi:phospholipase D Z-like protein [Tanacetum coccineum]